MGNWRFGAFPKLPYSTMQQLNLDWILDRIRRFLPDNGTKGQVLTRTKDGAAWVDPEAASGAVSSVNGKTGAVVLTASDVGALPSSYQAPVTSVNGKTGAVQLAIPDSTSDLTNDSGFITAAQAAAAAPVQSVNGQTGNVVIQTGGSPLDAYPIGSIYMSVNSTSPASLFGGTWETLENRFLLGAGSDYTAGTTGGEAEHTLTVDEMPSHKHEIAASTLGTSFGSRYLQPSDGANNSTDETKYTGGGQPHNNMPPYLAVYMWKRTA